MMEMETPGVGNFSFHGGIRQRKNTEEKKEFS